MTDQPTLEQLSDWLSSPTTEWFFTYAQREWGPSGLRYQQAVRAAAESANAVIELQKVLYAQESVLALVKYPAEELRKKRDHIKRELLAPSPGRRGHGF
jgi:hypothetical protein